MQRHTTLLIPSGYPELIADLVVRRPDWEVIPLSPARLHSSLPPSSWAFVDWIGESMSGLELCRRLRENRSAPDLHITMVLDQGDSDERRRSLKAGADDYVQGPLDSEIVFQRVVTGSASGETANPLRSRLVNGELSIDLAAHQLRWRDNPIPLRPNEFRLLTHFMEHPDQVFSRTALIERLGKDDEAIDERTVDVWVGRLRRSLTAQRAPDPLRTVRALGYVMDSAN
jgi:two-component system, OmpR family, phosphate regulon response regulator PhoB